MADAIAFALLHAMFGRTVFVLRFQDRERDGFGSRIQRTPEDIVDSAFGPAARPMIDDINRGSSLLNANIRAAIPAPIFESRINQLEPNLGFITGHSLFGLPEARFQRRNCDVPLPKAGGAGSRWRVCKLEKRRAIAIRDRSLPASGRGKRGRG